MQRPQSQIRARWAELLELQRLATWWRSSSTLSLADSPNLRKKSLPDRRSSVFAFTPALPFVSGFVFFPSFVFHTSTRFDALSSASVRSPLPHQPFGSNTGLTVFSFEFLMRPMSNPPVTGTRRPAATSPVHGLSPSGLRRTYPHVHYLPEESSSDTASYFTADNVYLFGSFERSRAYCGATIFEWLYSNFGSSFGGATCQDQWRGDTFSDSPTVTSFSTTWG